MMMSEGAGELNSAVGAAPAVLPGQRGVGARTTVPIILTRHGSRRRRAPACRLAVCASSTGPSGCSRDCATLTSSSPAMAACRSPAACRPTWSDAQIDGDVTDGIERLRAELGPEAMIVGADNVWFQPARFDRGMRVVDAASRRAAAEAVFRDAQQETVGIVDRLLNRKIASRLTRLFLVHLPAAPALLTLIAGFVGVYGALMVAVGNSASVLTGFMILEGFAILDGCAGELARVRLHQTAFGAWLDTVVGDFVNVLDDPGGRLRALAPRRDLPRHEDGAGCRGDDAVLRRRVIPRADAAGRGRRDEAALVVRLRSGAEERQRRRVRTRSEG